MTRGCGDAIAPSATGPVDRDDPRFDRRLAGVPTPTESDGHRHAPAPRLMGRDVRVRMVASDFGRGGAARAATRIAEAIAQHSQELGVTLDLRSVTGPAHPLGGVAPYPGGWARAVRYASSLRRRAADRLPWTPATTELHSRADVWTGLGRELNRADVDVINLRWLGTGTLSIEEIGRLTHPVVLSLHDMWVLCGAEHVSYDERYVTGYRRGDRPAGEAGVDWNRRTWRRKRRSWRRPMHLTTPSRWLADCVRRSALMSDWPVTVIPNPLDTDFWRPADRVASRAGLGLPTHRTLVLAGADGGMGRFVKGGDLLDEALHRLPGRTADRAGNDIEVVTFGGAERWREPPGRLPFPVHHLGQLEDDRMLRETYSACDVMVVPSRLEAFGQTASEAQACGTPVVAFDAAGPRDIVDDGSTGRLAAPFDPESLADAIWWVIEDPSRRDTLGARARAQASVRFAPHAIASAYVDVYRAAREAWMRAQREPR